MRLTKLVIFVLTLIPSTSYGQSSHATWLVKGCLVDRINNDPLLFANITVPGTNDTTVTDAQGCFTLHLHTDPSKDRFYLRIDYLGFVSYSTRIKRQDLDRGRIHRIKRRKFAPDVAEATAASVQER